MQLIALIQIFIISIYVKSTQENNLSEENEEYLRFPSNFLLGAATAAYQIEGAWNVSDKGESIWDRFTHEGNDRIVKNETGDVACDSYHKFREDISLLKQVGADAYRFSLSWPRILPNGFSNKVSKDGIKYYHNLIDELLANDIEPIVTLYHWDLPQILEDAGGWLNPLVIDWFVDYARIAFKEYAPKVKKFITLNEPSDNCIHVYAMGIHAPGKLSLHGIGEYICADNMLKAHARVYRMYQNEFKNTYNGSLGINVHSRNFYPKHENDSESAKIAFQFAIGWILHPIYSEKGDYPDLMKRMIAIKSQQQGYLRSRLPELDAYWINYIRGTSDFIAINHYTSVRVEQGNVELEPSFYNDQGLIRDQDPTWEGTISVWLKIIPEGFGIILRKLAAEYNNPPMYITENGVSGQNTPDDDHRVTYFEKYLKEMLICIHRDKVNIKGYLVWSFLDSLEWERGYGEPFGIVYVNFTDPERKRTLKKSAHWWQKVIKYRSLKIPTHENVSTITAP
ncbi:PREDICTED: myrosinase 1-like [Polistes dominula]|uniref:beta-glucosidase n=1 Tax=Polistes dominula TaxID=743375 RepID=A0ABM1IP74_POLDO|nr:PREDICTED: myrosinase 1-like [Polistes dominula]XP_015191850.1 PREDICTED: myrosinase 1-like [Polistes dominula]